MAFGGNSINAVLLDGTQTIFGAKTFSTTPKFPTQAAGSNNTYGATTAFVATAITNAIASKADTSYVDNAVSTLNNDVVKLTGNQNVSGAKTWNSLNNFTAGLKTTFANFKNSDADDVIYIDGTIFSTTYKNRNVTFGSHGTDEIGFWPYFAVQTDVNGKELSAIRAAYNSNRNNAIEFVLKKATALTDTSTASFAFNCGSDGIWFKCHDCRPATDNQKYLGNASLRWKQLFAVTSTINTSDEREKQQIADVPENVLDAWAEVNFCQFKFNDAVAEKGDAARLHTGLIAQRIKSVFEAHGLDAAAYGLFCFDAWDKSEDVPAGDRYALRYEECLTLEAAYQRRRADRIEARLQALEKALKND